MLMGSTANEFVAKISAALVGASRKGIHVTAGAGTCDLEDQQFSRRTTEEEVHIPTGRPHHLEKPPGPRLLGDHDGTSRLCYFLDGVQSAREIGRIEMAPVIAATVAAAIVNRCDRRFSRMPLESPPALVQAVILPRSAGDAKVEAFWELLLEAGFSELGPDETPSSPHLVLDSAEYTAQRDPSDYVGMRERARVRVRALWEWLAGGMLRQWELDRADSLAPFIARLNRIRRSNPALQSDRGLRFHGADNHQLLVYSKRTPDRSNVMLMAVNMDPHHTQSGWLELDLAELGLGSSEPFQVHDLLGDIDSGGYTLTWITRSPRFFPLEYTKLTLELTSPDYVDHFHGLEADTRDRLVAEQAALYKGIDSSLINAIYDLLYTKSRSGRLPVTLRGGGPGGRAPARPAPPAPPPAHPGGGGAPPPPRPAPGAPPPPHDPATGTYTLSLSERDSATTFEHRCQGLVLATGYRYEVPDFLAPLRERLRFDDQGRFAVRRDYSVDRGESEDRGHGAKGGVFVQNAELHTHGFTAPDLGMAAHRNSWIIAGLLGREYYGIERAIAYQSFGPPHGSAAHAEVGP
jgi:hypothetical protein